MIRKKHIHAFKAGITVLMAAAAFFYGSGFRHCHTDSGSCRIELSHSSCCQSDTAVPEDDSEHASDVNLAANEKNCSWCADKDVFKDIINVSRGYLKIYDQIPLLSCPAEGHVLRRSPEISCTDPPDIHPSLLSVRTVVLRA